VKCSGIGPFGPAERALQQQRRGRLVALHQRRDRRLREIHEGILADADRFVRGTERKPESRPVRCQRLDPAQQLEQVVLVRLVPHLLQPGHEPFLLGLAWRQGVRCSRFRCDRKFRLPFFGLPDRHRVTRSVARRSAADRDR
jgi:hypothetical protein